MILHFLAKHVDGSLRIKDYYNLTDISTGSNTAKGAIEIYHLGVWGGICYPNLPIIAIIACKQLGYTVGYQRIYSQTHYPTTYRKIWIHQIQCFPNDTKLSDCRFTYGLQTIYNASNCGNRYQVECIRKYIIFGIVRNL